MILSEIESKFEAIESSVRLNKHAILETSSCIANSIEKLATFNSLKLFNLLNKRRDELLRVVVHEESRCLSQATLINKSNMLHYSLKSHSVRLTRLFKIFYSNELSIREKLLYFEYLRPSRVNVPDKFHDKANYRLYLVKADKYLIYDIKSHELSVYECGGGDEPTRKIAVYNKNRQFFLLTIHVFDGRIICLLRFSSHSYIYIFDEYLTMLTGRRFNEKIVSILAPNVHSFMSYSETSRDFFILDYELRVLHKSVREMMTKLTNSQFSFYGPVSLVSDDHDGKICITRSKENKAHLDVISTRTGQTLSSIPINTSSSFFLNADASGNIYIRMRCDTAVGDQFMLYCYDSDGHLLYQKFYPELNDQVNLNLIDQQSIMIIDSPHHIIMIL